MYQDISGMRGACRNTSEASRVERYVDLHINSLTGTGSMLCMLQGQSLNPRSAQSLGEEDTSNFK